MKRSGFNIAIDLVAATLMLAMIATGIILRFTLPPGSGRAIALWNLARRQWGDLHFWLALGAVSIVVLHLALHWTSVVSVVRRWIVGTDQGVPTARLRLLAGLATLLIVSSVVTGFWLTSVRATQPLSAPGPETAEHQIGGESIRGNMTVAETATALHCSVNQIRERLHLPADASDSERLGQIAKQRGITMPEIRKQLEP